MEEDKLDFIGSEAFKSVGYEKAPDNFTAIVMQNIQEKLEKEHSKEEPLITKLGWFMIFIICSGAFAVFSIFSQPAARGNDSVVDGILTSAGNFLEPLYSGLHKFIGQLGLLIIIAGSATILLLADRFLAKRFRTAIKLN